MQPELVRQSSSASVTGVPKGRLHMFTVSAAVSAAQRFLRLRPATDAARLDDDGGGGQPVDSRSVEERRRDALVQSASKFEYFVASSFEQVAQRMETSLETGLSDEEAKLRLLAHGPNELDKAPPKPFWKLLLEQFEDLLVILLIVASLVSMALGQFTEAITIIVIILANATLGVIQEQKAGAELDALSTLAAPRADVLRSGRIVRIDSAELVPGDVVVLELGAKVPADVRLSSGQGLYSNEMALTGESEGVKKDANWVSAVAGQDAAAEEDDKPLTDRNMVYMGCDVQDGHGRGIVVKTGMQTRMGAIAKLMAEADETMSPLQFKLHKLGVKLGLASVAVSVLVFVIGVSTERGADPNSDQPVWLQMLLVAVSLTVAAVPEGLPACVTITLAVGMFKMAENHALIRKLHSVETLGSASVICTDKTGTLTAGQMTAVRLFYSSTTFRITGKGFNPEGYIVPEVVDERNDASVAAAAEELAGGFHRFPLLLALLCSNAEIQFNEENNHWEAVGNSTERPLVVAAAKAGYRREDTDTQFHKVAENPFKSERKMMSVLIDVQGADAMREYASLLAVPGSESGAAAAAAAAAEPQKSKKKKKKKKKRSKSSNSDDSAAAAPFVSCVKGAPNYILDQCTAMIDGDSVRPLTEDDHADLLQKVDEFSSQAFRVLAVAYRPLASADETGVDVLEHELVFAGLVASMDPERIEVMPSIEKAANAGIRTVMITGDYVKTAKAIAENINILPRGSPAEKAVDCRIIRELGNELEALEAQLARAQAVNDTAEARIVAAKVENCNERLDHITAYADVYARAKPVDKITIVRSLQRQGNVCSMTGDGVNDAPALKQADIGVAMGITGTDVAKASADMVLTDDNFCNIVEAVEEGRTIYANICKFVYFLLSCNMSEVLVILLAVILGMQSPLLPIQILWMNLATDGAPAVALAVEPTEPGIMEEGPRSRKEQLLEKVMITGITVQTVVFTSLTLVTYITGLIWETGVWNGHIETDDKDEQDALQKSIRVARTMTILQITFSELLRAYTSRSLRVSVFTQGVFSNPWMQWAVGTAIGATLFISHVPGVMDVFELEYLSGRHWGMVLGMCVIPAIVDELTKLVYRRTGFGLRPKAVHTRGDAELLKRAASHVEAPNLIKSKSGQYQGFVDEDGADQV